MKQISMVAHLTCLAQSSDRTTSRACLPARLKDSGIPERRSQPLSAPIWTGTVVGFLSTAAVLLFMSQPVKGIGGICVMLSTCRHMRSCAEGGDSP